jgi:hypothetical protein
MFYDAVQLDAETVNDGVNALAAWVSLQNMRFPLAAMRGCRQRETRCKKGRTFRQALKSRKNSAVGRSRR